MKTYSRSSRIGKKIQRGVSEYIRTALRDPRLRMVTITGVEMSSDLSVARVFYSVNGNTRERNHAQAGFKSAGGFIRRALAANLEMKYTPNLKFIYDGSLDYGTTMDRLLEEIKTENVPADKYQA